MKVARPGRARRLGLAFLVVAIVSGTAGAQRQGDPPEGAGDGAAEAADDLDRAVALIVNAQEGAEWPYEGVYRVRGEIPVGYRIGGTAICAMAVARAPGYAESERRQAAVRRAVEFICDGVDHPRMSHEIDATYDVRGWGYTYGLLCLLQLKAAGRLPADPALPVEAAIDFFLRGIEATSIPVTGGWHYARRAGFDEPGPHAPFMTAPTLLALFEAARQGCAVDAAVVDRGLAALEQSRTTTGAYMYAGAAGTRRRDLVPGSIGRMVAAEAVLALAGRSDRARVRGSLDAFLAHWSWLDDRRAKPGTHARPYGVAPYYFYFAHEQAARAIELLPRRERREYRRRLRELLRSVRQDDGGWNDRVFPRSASYGTAMAVLALTAPAAPAPATWPAERESDQ